MSSGRYPDPGGSDFSSIYLLNPREDILRRIKALAPSVGFNSLSFYSECTNLSTDLEVATASGSGDAQIDDTVNGGAVLFSTGTTNSSARIARPRETGAPGSTTRFVSNSRTQAWAAYSRFKLVATPASSGKACIIANLYDSANDTYLGGLGATSTANWVFTVGGTPADTGVAFDTNVHDGLVINDGMNVKAYLDWVQVGIAAASSGIGTGTGYPRWYDLNGTTSQNVSHRMYRTALAVVKATPSGVAP